MFPIKDNAPAGKFPFVNLAIIALTIYVFFLELAAPDLELFVRRWALIPSQIDLSNLASLTPFVTSLFLHAGWLHIVSNMWFLWIFGDNVEEKLGHVSYLVFYLLTGVISGLTQYFVMSNSDIPTLGASGAIAGVLGVYLVFFSHHKVDTLIPIFIFPLIIQLPAGVMLLWWFFTQFFSGVASLGTSVEIGGVAWWAHVGGFTFGWLVGKMVKD